MTTYGMVIDVSRCTGCHSCFLACRDEHAGNDHRPIAAPQPQSGHRWIDVQEHERGRFPRVRVDYVPVLCQHYADDPNIGRCGDGSVYRRPDGIVIIDPDKAAGRRDIVAVSPDRTIFWNESEAVAQQCTFCAHLLDKGWKQPRCVEACPTHALVFGDLDDPSSEVSLLFRSDAAEDLRPELGLKPSVRYVGLPKRFLAGEVVFADRMGKAAQGVSLALRRGDETRASATDAFGEFFFEGLEKGAAYALQITAPGCRPKDLSVTAHGDADLGVIVLEPE